MSCCNKNNSGSNYAQLGNYNQSSGCCSSMIQAPVPMTSVGGCLSMVQLPVTSGGCSSSIPMTSTSGYYVVPAYGAPGYSTLTHGDSKCNSSGNYFQIGQAYGSGGCSTSYMTSLCQ